jgi:formate dehydrogenase alpha subunit
MIELTIDGKRVRTKKQSTILEAALNNGIKIPNLCYDKRLTPYGGCRLCIVEIEGQRKLEASCATFAKEGMVVWTDTPRVRKIRQTVLEFMLVHHPLECPICDKAGECVLQDLVYQYGKPEGRFIREKKQMPLYTKGALIELNANRCILCGKCVRLCAEHQGREALGFIGRGFSTVVQPAFGEVLECDFCGQCIDICPTGALLNKSLKFKARPWFLEERDTICPFCSCGCTLTLGIMEGKILRSRGREDRGVNEGNLCGRGRFGIDYIYSKDRLRTPLIREDGDLVPVSWDEALNYISKRLKDIITAHGPSSIGAIGSPRCTNEENYIFQKFMREVIGSDNIDSSAAFGYGIVERAWMMAFGTCGHRIDLRSPFGKDLILVIESDLSITHPIFGLNILQAKRQGAKLIVVDSRETKLTRHSTQWVRIKPGTGVAFLNGIMKVMIDRGLFNNQNALKIKGFSELKETLKDYTPERVSEITGIAKDELIDITEVLAKAQSRMLTLSLSVSENTKGLDTILTAANLINLLGESPDALQVPAEYANTFGLYQMGIRPDAGPYYQILNSSGKGVHEMLYKPGSIKALYIMGEDPAVTFPDTSQIVSTLKSLYLLVVQDIALTETAKLAHVILPAAGWAEKDGTFVNAEGVVQRVYKIIDPVGEVLPDWQIIKNLAFIMGKNIGITNREGITKEIKLFAWCNL